MKSRVSYLDVGEASAWIATQLAKEGVAVTERLVVKILNRETEFLVMGGLARPGGENSAQAGYILRERYWVVSPTLGLERIGKLKERERRYSGDEIRSQGY